MSTIVKTFFLHLCNWEKWYFTHFTFCYRPVFLHSFTWVGLHSLASFFFLPLSPLILTPPGQNHNPMNGCMGAHTRACTHTHTHTEKCEETAAEVDHQNGWGTIEAANSEVIYVCLCVCVWVHVRVCVCACVSVRLEVQSCAISLPRVTHMYFSTYVPNQPPISLIDELSGCIS